MIGEVAARRILEQALLASSADQTEALLMVTDAGVTRLANSAIHQNVAERNAELRVRVVRGRRIGVAVTNQLSPAAIAEVVESANRVASLSGENHDFVSLPAPAAVPTMAVCRPNTASCPPEVRARLVGVVCRRASAAGLHAAGVLTTAGYELAVANSLGMLAYHQSSYADLVVVVMSDDSSGYAERASIDVAELDAAAVADEAIARALRGRNPVELEPGEYEAILEPYAVHDLVEWVATLGFNALAYQEGRSFVNGHRGQPLVGDNISLWDDGLDQAGLPLPFDFEGVPKRRVDLITAGRAVDLVHDSFTAGREGTTSTGHARPAPNTNGPVPMHLFLAPGESTVEEMIASTRRGVLVTRFHYTNPADRQRAIITGMTRDGTFLVENGEITRPVKNLRFTQSFLQALSDVQMIGRTPLMHREWLGSITAPAIRIGRWHF